MIPFLAVVYILERLYGDKKKDYYDIYIFN